MRIRTLILLLLVLADLVGGVRAYAASGDCISGPCIDVTTDPITGEVIGRGTLIAPGGATTRATVNRSRTKKKKSPIVAPIVNPICTIEQLATFTCIKTVSPVATPPLPRTKTLPARPTIISTDEVRRSLPRAHPGFQPSVGAVVNVPVIFWSGLVAPAQFSLALLGHTVEVNMNAQFVWSWGDGTYLTTTLLGAPFPDQSLSHTYSRSGSYQVSVVTTWSGSAILGQTSLQIIGPPIETVDQTHVVVKQAPTMLTPIE